MLVSIFLISAAVLAYEIILMRIFSITQWSHFAYMIISIALLGFGASGTLIAILRRRLIKRFLFSYRLFACLFPLSILGSYFLSQQNAFNPFEIVWNPRQYFHLLEYYLVLFVPFLLAATCIGLMFTQYTQKIGLVYCANLIGSGVGAIGAVGCLYVMHPVKVVYVIVGVGVCGIVATFFSREGREVTRRLILVFLFCMLVASTVLAVKYDPLKLQNHLNISQYKGLSLAKKFPGAKVLAELVSPLGVVHAVSSPIIRNAPGLSLNYTGDIPRQIALFSDSGNAGVITSAKGLEGHPPAPLKGGFSLEFLDFLSSALVYHVRPVSTVLILGAGGGTDVLNTLYHQATKVDAVELDANIIALVRGQFRDFVMNLYDRLNVRVINQEARGYVENARATYDSMQISLLDSFSASSAGVYALNENYLYTVEALKQYYSRLTPQGILSITRWVKFPPRDDIKLLATAVEALEELGIANRAKYLVSIRSWATCTLLVSKSPFTDEEINRLRAFCHERSFDTNYFPGIQPGEANIYNQIPFDEYYRAAQELLFGNKKAFYASYPYFVKPAHDDAPYFFHFFKWQSLPALLKTMGKEWIPFLEWGYLVLLATLLQAGVISVILIMLPLLTLTRRSDGERVKPPERRWYVYTVMYFTCLGLGYLFLEMVFIQKFTLFLANPVSAVSVIIASFLISSGFGSLYFEVRGSRFRVQGTTDTLHLAPWPLDIFSIFGGIVGLAVGYIVLLPLVFSSCSGWSPLGRILMTVGLITPLGFCMGMPFPLGMSRIHAHVRDLIPWAYGINGCASVLSSLIATCIAIPWGFRTVILCAALLYLGAGGIALRMKDR